MLNIDVVILSYGKNEELRRLTRDTIHSLVESEKDIRFNIFVVEQQHGINYAQATTVNINEPFNYNRFMNKGISIGMADYVALCNNDLRFYEGWASRLIAAMKDNDLLSASPFCPNMQGRMHRKWEAISYGYKIRHELSGWCIVCNRKLFDIIGQLEEGFPFWFADNIYAMQLKKHGIKHALIRDSLVLHYGSKTLKTMQPAQQHKLTWEEKKRFAQLYGKTE
ncbi:MAG TPA: hypothetical protein VG603_15240 [Chitinophagales bacterium]|nr:hypothetical protein [Chitinophagales bacterium]